MVQILAEIGDDNLKFQILSQVVTHASRTRANKAGKVTFAVEAEQVNGFMDGTRQALIVWIDKARLDEVVAEGMPVPDSCAACPYECGCDAYCAKRDGGKS